MLTRRPVNCKEEKCENREAYFRQVQIRSADEPMTTFYKVSRARTFVKEGTDYWFMTDTRQCTLCAAEWREN